MSVRSQLHYILQLFTRKGSVYNERTIPSPNTVGNPITMIPALLLADSKLDTEAAVGGKPGNSFSSVCTRPPKSPAACWSSTPACCKSLGSIPRFYLSAPEDRPRGLFGYGDETATVFRAVCATSLSGPKQSRSVLNIHQQWQITELTVFPSPTLVSK